MRAQAMRRACAVSENAAAAAAAKPPCRRFVRKAIKKSYLLMDTRLFAIISAVIVRKKKKCRLFEPPKFPVVIVHLAISISIFSKYFRCLNND